MLKARFIIGIFSVGLVACGGGGSGGGRSAVNTKSFETIETSGTNIIGAGGDKLNYNLAQDQFYFYDFKLKVGGREFDLAKGAELDLNQFANGLSTKTAEIDAKYKDGNGNIKDESSKATIFAYKQNDSGVLGIASSNGWGKVDIIIGKSTPKENIPSKGVLTYQGSAFGYQNGLVRGDLEYRLDFDNNIGYGAIEGLTNNIIELQPAKIVELRSKSTNRTMIGVSGAAKEVGRSSQIPLGEYGVGKYELGIFGPNGKEIAGHTEAITESLTGYQDIYIDGKPVSPKTVAWRAGLVGQAR